ARDVRRHFHLVRQTNARDLAKRRVRLLRGRGVDAGADATLLRALLEGGRCALRAHLLATLSVELIEGRDADWILSLAVVRERVTLRIRPVLSRASRGSGAPDWSPPLLGAVAGQTSELAWRRPRPACGR